MSDTPSPSPSASPSAPSAPSASAAASPMAPAAAQAEIASLTGNSDFRAKLLSQDPAARAQWDNLHLAAFPPTPTLDTTVTADGSVTQRAKPSPPAEADHSKAFQVEAEQVDTADQIDRWFPVPPPHEYVLPRIAGPDEQLSAEHAKIDQQTRGWLAEARFPSGVGSSVAADIAKTAEKYSQFSPEQKELYRSEERAKLERVFGERTEEMMDLAEDLVFQLEAKSPGIVNVLRNSGGAVNASVVAQLALQAERNRDRQAALEKRPKK